MGRAGIIARLLLEARTMPTAVAGRALQTWRTGREPWARALPQRHAQRPRCSMHCPHYLLQPRGRQSNPRPTALLGCFCRCQSEWKTRRRRGQGKRDGRTLRPLGPASPDHRRRPVLLETTPPGIRSVVVAGRRGVAAWIRMPELESSGCRIGALGCSRSGPADSFTFSGGAARGVAQRC